MTFIVDGTTGLTFNDSSTQNVTALNASNISAGTLGKARLPTGSVLQVISNNWNTHLSYNNGDGTGQSGAGFSVIPSNGYVNITAIGSNSKFLVVFDGNLTASADTNQADWIGGYGLVVDPAGGTSWTRVGSGTGSGTNVKFFSSRAQPNQGTPGGDAFWAMPANLNLLYSSSATTGATLRFAIEYFHYDNGGHDILYINRRGSTGLSTDSYTGNLATTLTVMEIAA